MRVTMEMTLDGLVRALRLTAHGLAEDAEAGYLRGDRAAARRTFPSFDRFGTKATDTMMATDPARDEVGE